MVEGNANLRPGLAANRSRNSSIRLRRYPSNIPTLPPSSARPQSQRYDSDHSQAIDAAPQVDEHGDIVLTTGPSARRARAISEPQRDTTHRHQYEPNPRGSGNVSNLDDVIEERKSLAQRPMDFDVRTDNEKLQQRQRDGIHKQDVNQRKRASTVSSAPGRGKMKVRGHEYDAEMVDLLDLVDPEIQTLSTLTNVQNSLFIPNFGRFLNRRPTYNLTQAEKEQSDSELSELSEVDSGVDQQTQNRLQRVSTKASILSEPTSDHYAVLPHGTDLDGWSREDQRLLDDHVRHMLHSKRSKFKRSLKGFGQYVRKPLGFFVTLYATLITLFGLAWVLFLIGWINVGGRQLYIINIIDNVLVALFAIMGDGLIPWRIVDTYHMVWIAHYAHLTWRLRKEKRLPKLEDHNELPRLHETDIEAADKIDEAEELSVLSPLQQKRLIHHQTKFANSHTFYKPHETSTHHAFPIRLLIAVVTLLDAHSCLQVSLGLCTWIIPYQVRPFALTTVILCCSITVNITAGILISIGDHKTRKKEVLERMHKQELTAEAIRKIEKQRAEEEEQDQELERDVRKKSGIGSNRPSMDLFRSKKSGVGERPAMRDLGEPASGDMMKNGNVEEVVVGGRSRRSGEGQRGPAPAHAHPAVSQQRPQMGEGKRSVLRNGII